MKKIKADNLNIIWGLAAATPIFIMALLLFRNSPKKQFEVLAVASLIYLVAAFLHHLKDKSLNLEVMIEYVLIAALALVILQSLLF